MQYTVKAIDVLKQAIIRFFQGGNISSNQETNPNDIQSDSPKKTNVQPSARYSPWRSEYPDNHWIRWG